MTVSSRDPQRSSTSIGAVDTRPLRQQIADTLQQAILDGELLPGAAIVESDIAQRLGVSRAPVREALQILSRTDLVETTPYRGTVVRRLTPDDIDEIYSLRTALESFALERAMARDLEGLSRALRQSCDQMQRLAAAKDWSGLADEDAQFHEILVERAEHRLLMQAWRDLYLKVRQVMALRNLQNEDSMDIYHNHVRIVASLERGDIQAASQGLRAHIATAADLVLEEPAGPHDES
jgi:DNA-binding GntR family transcriptional regulator